MRRVLIIYTGGTIGMDQDGDTLRPPPLSRAGLARRLQRFAPELSRLARIDLEIAMNVDSANVGPDEWLALAARVRASWSRYDGVVILHGTDTIAYTASALSFLLQPCRVPVILTGSQRPLSAIRTDARRNLVSAVEIAAQGTREVVRQVGVFFDDCLFQGNRVRKRSASDFSGLESPLAPPLARVGTEITYAKPTRRSRARATQARAQFDRRVALLSVTPGFPSDAVTEGLLPRVSALVLVAFASGTAPTHEPAFIAMLREARRRGVPVVVATENASRAELSGAREEVRYQPGRVLEREGCLFAGAMTPECAYVKAAWLLAQPGGAKTFAKRWTAVVAGER
jgi:L-asparaginase